MEKSYDVIIIGGGHAGCEAALASARLGSSTLLLTMNLDHVAFMPCNPNIGGTSKGHLVKEIDALGGEMGKNIDKSFIQSRILNKSKGPAVYSLRAQADKNKYKTEMKKTLEAQENLTLRQNEVVELIIKDKIICGVKTESDQIYNAKAVVICAGTYLNSRCLYGKTIINSGPNGMKNSALSDTLNITHYRFKTGTPARIDSRSIDYSKMEIQHGDEQVEFFSFENENKEHTQEQLPCYLTYTNEETHKIITDNISLSPMYSGEIKGTGTRYCPSIEDKIVRFADKNRHQIFIEPEGLDTNEMYVQGMSTSLPEDVQEKMYQSIEGLENCKIMRTAYAIEYDCIDATQLKLNLEFKETSGLFSAGQYNGSSGYEEAASQGLIAGINAHRFVQNLESLILSRSQAYIGVLIDDLVTKGTKEPYRMMTSRAEYRLYLRQDNADLRLTEIGHNIGLISDERFEKFQEKKHQIDDELERIRQITVPPNDELKALLQEHNSPETISGMKLVDLIKRTELNYFILAPLDHERQNLPLRVQEQVNIIVKYEGYIKKQQEQIDQFKKLENKILDKNLNYNELSGLRLEARQKLSSIKPHNIGQASRITGVSPADISVLLIYLKTKE